MKKLRLIASTVLVILIANSSSWAQTNGEFKINMSSGRLVVNGVDEVRFEGYSGNEVILSNLDHKNREDSERSKGLKLINGLGLEDNTNIGLNVQDKDGAKVISQLSRHGDGEYLIKVPKGVTIVYEHGSVYGGDVVFKNISGEIEVTTTHSDVELDNVTGPMTVSTVHGDIEGSFSSVSQSNAISIVSSHGDIDLGIPSGTKANMKLSTSWGQIYSDLDIEIDRGNSSMKSYSQNNVEGTVGGGGVSFNVRSTHGTIYLRKK